MKIYTEILGNANLDKDWESKLSKAEVEHIYLDQWTAQKSRFVIKGDKGNEYAIALKRNAQVLDGDIVSFDPIHHKAVVIKVDLSPVMIIDMSALATMEPQNIIRISVELGHALGNQHWPAVVKGTSVYVPLTVDEKVMLSVMQTHKIDGITYKFQKGMEIIPYLAPHEIRRLFGGASQESHTHETLSTQGYIPGHLPQAHKHDHLHEHDHCHDDSSHQHEHNYTQKHGHIHHHNYEHGHGHDHSHSPSK